MQNLKCRTADHSKRHGEFIDIVDQCNNTTSSDRPASAVDGDYSTYVSGVGGGSGDNEGRRSGDGRRNNNNNNNNGEFSVNRQDFNSNRGSGGGYDRDQSSCSDARPQQYSVSVKKILLYSIFHIIIIFFFLRHYNYLRRRLTAHRTGTTCVGL